MSSQVLKIISQRLKVNYWKLLMIRIMADVEGNVLVKGDDKTLGIDHNAYTIIKEGTTEAYFPVANDVFYNPVQEFNRDLSVAVLRRFSKEYASNGKENTVRSQTQKTDPTEGIDILEGLSASGLRAIRYAKEIPGVRRILANDISFQAVESIRRNVQFNKVENLVETSEKDVTLLMYEHRQQGRQFNVVDLDPYGTAAKFLDAGVQAVCDGGVLLVTCTDVAILCGNNSEKCHANYGAMSLKGKFCHEMALRIVLQSIESHANRYGRYIKPILSVSVDFYVRIFVKVFSGQGAVKHSASKLAMVYKCTGCETCTLQPIGRCIAHHEKNNFKFLNAIGPTIEPLCKHCNSPHQLGGPIWTDPMHDYEFVKGLLTDINENPIDLRTAERIQGMLSVILEVPFIPNPYLFTPAFSTEGHKLQGTRCSAAAQELPDIPLFYTLDKLCNIVHILCPKMKQFRSAFLNAGYRVSGSHVCGQAIKTDAPSDFVWDVLRQWVKSQPRTRVLTDKDVGKYILDKEPGHAVSFDEHPEAEPESKRNRLLRFQKNPEKHWGPKSRAKSSALHDAPILKSTRLQGKHSRKAEKTASDLKQFPCKRFKKGVCDLGDDCKYSHSDPNVPEKDEGVNH